jgi:hypothetical protein
LGASGLLFKKIIFSGFDIKNLFLLKDGFNTDDDILTSFSKTVSPFDVTSVPAPIYILAIGNPSPGHTTSAIKSLSAVAAGPFFNTIVRLEVFPSIGARACPALVRYNYLFSLFTQIFPFPFVFSRLWRKNPSHPLCGWSVPPAVKTISSNVFNLKKAIFMPIKLHRAIQPLWAFSAIAHKDVAFTF